MTPQQFFYKYSGWGYDPKKETPRQGRTRGAIKLAKAEAMARDRQATYEWHIDQCSDSREFSDKKPHWKLWVCVIRDNQHMRIGSLHGIDFGRRGEPWADPYKRVVEAELALEYLT